MLTWGFFLSNFPRAARTVKERRLVLMAVEDDGEVEERKGEMKEVERRVLGVNLAGCVRKEEGDKEKVMEEEGDARGRG